MTFESRAVRSGRRLVNHFKASATLTIRRLAGTLSAATRGVTPTVTSAAVRCTIPTPYSRGVVDGERIRERDLRTLIRSDDPALTFTPAPEMLADFAGTTYRIAGVSPMAGSIELQLRGLE